MVIVMGTRQQHPIETCLIIKSSHAVPNANPVTEWGQWEIASARGAYCVLPPGE